MRPPTQGPAGNLPSASKLHFPSSQGDGPEVPRTCTNQFSPIVGAMAVAPMGRVGEGAGGLGTGAAWGGWEKWVGERLNSGVADPGEWSPVSTTRPRVGWAPCMCPYAWKTGKGGDGRHSVADGSEGEGPGTVTFFLCSAS